MNCLLTLVSLHVSLCLSQSIRQSPLVLVTPPGHPVSINCTVDGADTPNMYWYRQEPTGGTLLLLSYSVSKDSVEQLTLSHFQPERPTNSQFSIRSSTAQVNDSGTYYCAWSLTGEQTEGKP
ncbi:hypothetical protein XELAEV_18034161mg [Xenopus laevis]|uniref:Ig-like domain-containing protein n=1 Tax=Xenopus laevis TaxID=8355 RepID=A0A974CDE6_XENLA|nr:hypothetical protein XELAEV_18034161mg [Xenopus laevis]